MKIVIFSLFLFHSQPKEQTIVIDLKHFKWTAYDYDGKEIKTGLASGGKRYCPDINRGCKTLHGIFYPLVKYTKYHRSSLYPLDKKNKAKMPWAVKINSQSIHGSSENEWKGNFFHHSHGCIHVENKMAQWINLFVTHLTKIIVLPY